MHAETSRTTAEQGDHVTVNFTIQNAAPTDNNSPTNSVIEEKDVGSEKEDQNRDDIKSEKSDRIEMDEKGE